VGLFTYEEPVQLLLNFKSGSEKNVAKTLKYKVVNTSGAQIMAGRNAVYQRRSGRNEHD
jgi:hypothetical protein